jgi:hypothetical protein
MKERFMGMVHTIWSPAEPFLDAYYGISSGPGDDDQVKCFKALFDEINTLTKTSL